MPSSTDIRKENLRTERKQISGYEQRLGELKKAQDRQLEMQEQEGDERSARQTEKINNKMARLSGEYAERLEKIKDDFTKTKTLLDMETELLRDSNNEQIKLLREDNRNKGIDLHRKHNQKSQLDQENFQLSNQKINTEFNLKTHQVNDQKQRELHSTVHEGEKKIFLAKDEFEKTMLENENNFTEAMIRQNNLHKRGLEENSKSFFRKIQKREEEQNTYMNTEKLKHQQRILQSQQDFEKKYSQVRKDLEEHMDILSKESTEKLEDLKKSLEAKEGHYTDIVKDPFYRPTLLNPRVEEKENHFLISLYLPPYEQNMVALSAKGKEVKLTKTRDFQDKVEADDGSTNKYHKAESYSKTFTLDSPVEGKKISKSYQNGKLVFTLSKIV